MQSYHDIQKAISRKIARRLIPFLGLLYLLAFLDRVNVGFAALTMNADLGFSARVFGTGAGVFFVGYVLFGVPSNLMLHRVGARRWIGHSMIVWGGVSASMAIIRTPATFYALRFLLGTAEAGFFPGTILYLAYWFPKKDGARILSAFMVALPLSSVIGAPISATLLDLNVLGLRGWQLLFLLEGIPAMVVGVIALKILIDRPEQATWLTPQQREVLNHSLQAPIVPMESSNARYAFTHPAVWNLGAAYFALLLALYGYNFWSPAIIQGLGAFTHRQIGALTMLPSFAAAILMYAWGRHSDATAERRWHVALPLILAGAGLATAAYVHEPMISMIALTLGAVGIYSSLPIFWSLPRNVLHGASAAAGVALINSLGNVGGCMGSFAMGYVKDATGGYADGLVILATSLLIASLIVIGRG